MTGFGAAAGPVGAWHLRVELRSVNHRHLQLKLRLPAEVAALEPEIEAELRRALERGAVTLSASVERQAGAGAPLLDRALARDLVRQARELAAELGLAPELSLAQLLALPGVVASSGAAEIDAKARASGHAIVRKALDGLLAMRTAEGVALAADLEANLAALEKLAVRIEKRMPKVVRQLHSALHKRVRELLGPKRPVAENELARELALLADRSDVSEELARLKSHIAQFALEMRRDEPVGRRLDFLVQELLREVNTLSSKCNDAEVAHWSVDAKARIERLREQVQNVE